MPNDAYRRRLEEWQKQERLRRSAMEPPPPYDPTEMRSHVPMGCVGVVILGLLAIAYLVYRYLKLHGG